MYKYLLFSFKYDCSRGGMNDCVYRANKLDDLKRFAKKYIQEFGCDVDEIQYYDIESNKVYVANILVKELSSGQCDKKITAWKEKK